MNAVKHQQHTQHLQLVTHPPTSHAPEIGLAETVFSHWMLMLGKNRARCALGPSRRRAIERALALYDVETLLLAVEGCASSAWHAGANDRARPFDDLELILRDEAHIERFAADGEAVRERAERELARRVAAQSEAQAAPDADAEQAMVAHDRMVEIRREIVARMRGGAW